MYQDLFNDTGIFSWIPKHSFIFVSIVHAWKILNKLVWNLYCVLRSCYLVTSDNASRKLLPHRLTNQTPSVPDHLSYRRKLAHAVHTSAQLDETLRPATPKNIRDVTFPRPPIPSYSHVSPLITRAFVTGKAQAEGRRQLFDGLGPWGSPSHRRIRPIRCAVCKNLSGWENLCHVEPKAGTLVFKKLTVHEKSHMLEVQA
jgi:hypothetical protein